MGKQKPKIVHELKSIQYYQNINKREDTKINISSKLSRIEYVLKFATISLLMYKIKESIRNLFFIILRSLILTIFMVEKAQFIVAAKIGKVSKHITTL